MTKEGIYEFIARQKTSVLSSVGEGGNPGIDSASGEWLWKPFFTRFYRKGVTDPDYCILKFTGVEAQWFANQRAQTIKL